MTYFAMSDIHGFFAEFSRWLDRLGIPEDFQKSGNKLVLLGDYIDYGSDSCQVLEQIYALSQTMGDSLVVLRGNHEEVFLDWLELYSRPNVGEPDENGFVDWNGWFQSDAGADYQTFRSFVTPEQWAFFQRITPTTSELTQNIEAAGMILANHRELITWLRGLPYYHETERQIFVHAGIDEAYPALWRELTEPYIFVEKFPAATGSFPKDIIAGHVAASTAAGNRDHKGIFFDGESHYYIDGSVQRTGKLMCLAYDEATDEYYELLPQHGSSESSARVCRMRSLPDGANR